MKNAMRSIGVILAVRFLSAQAAFSPRIGLNGEARIATAK